jgi:hypothetical protein
MSCLQSVNSDGNKKGLLSMMFAMENSDVHERSRLVSEGAVAHSVTDSALQLTNRRKELVATLYFLEFK